MKLFNRPEYLYRQVFFYASKKFEKFEVEPLRKFAQKLILQLKIKKCYNFCDKKKNLQGSEQLVLQLTDFGNFSSKKNY